MPLRSVDPPGRMSFARELPFKHQKYPQGHRRKPSLIKGKRHFQGRWNLLPPDLWGPEASHTRIRRAT